MARALVLNPSIVFADEPTGNLDSKTSAEMMELMRHVLSEHNKTLVMVTHDNDLAALADRQLGSRMARSSRMYRIDEKGNLNDPENGG